MAQPPRTTCAHVGSALTLKILVAGAYGIGAALAGILWAPRTVSHVLTWAFSRHPHSPAKGVVGQP
jgi:hypothetical protein